MESCCATVAGPGWAFPPAGGAFRSGGTLHAPRLAFRYRAEFRLAGAIRNPGLSGNTGLETKGEARGTALPLKMEGGRRRRCPDGALYVVLE